MNEWISVKDRLPRHHETILVITKTTAQAVVIFLNDEHTIPFLKQFGFKMEKEFPGYAFCSQEIRGNVLNGVTHWTTLLEAPK